MSRREDKKAETRAAILSASLRLFQGKGFRETTMRDIAAEAGIALGTTYNYFPTKEHLALAFFERSLERVMRRFRREAGPEMALEERIFLLMAVQIEEMAPYASFLHAVVPQAAAPGSRLSPFGEDIGRLKGRVLDLVAEILDAAQDCGDLPDLPGYREMLLQAFWVYNLGILLFWLNDSSEASADTYALIDRTLRFLIGALREGGAMELIALADMGTLDPPAAGA
jgi:AcrR family transcriptional regulator